MISLKDYSEIGHRAKRYLSMIYTVSPRRCGSLTNTALGLRPSRAVFYKSLPRADALVEIHLSARGARADKNIDPYRRGDMYMYVWENLRRPNML